MSFHEKILHKAQLVRLTITSAELLPTAEDEAEIFLRTQELREIILASGLKLELHLDALLLGEETIRANLGDKFARLRNAIENLEQAMKFLVV